MREAAGSPGVAAAPREAGPEARPSPAAEAVRAVGHFALECVRHGGRSAILAWAVLVNLRTPRRYWSASLQQAKRVGVDGLALVLIVGGLSGALLAQQTGYQLSEWLPMSLVGGGVVGGMLTELGPVLTAIVLAGRMGAGIGAELGTMKVTDQIDALVTLGRDPVVELVVPRVVGGVIALLPLVILANAIGIFAGWITGMALLPMTSSDFIFGARSYYHSAALIFSLMKAPIFGFAITFTACYVGLRAEGGAAGVGRTATKAVVAIIVTIMVLDVLMGPLYKALK